MKSSVLNLITMNQQWTLFGENVFARHNPGSQGQLSADPARPRLMCESDLQSERGRARALQLSLRMRTTRRGFEPVRPEL